MPNQFAFAKWKKTTAVVIDSAYHYARLRDLNLDDYVDHSFFVICFSYVVDEEAYYDAFERHEPFEVGEHFSILYNPLNPSRNSFSKAEKTVWSRVVFWSLSAALAALMFYLYRHFDIPADYDFPMN